MFPWLLCLFFKQHFLSIVYLKKKKKRERRHCNRVCGWWSSAHKLLPGLGGQAKSFLIAAREVEKKKSLDLQVDPDGECFQQEKEKAPVFIQSALRTWVCDFCALKCSMNWVHCSSKVPQAAPGIHSHSPSQPIRSFVLKSPTFLRGWEKHCRWLCSTKTHFVSQSRTEPFPQILSGVIRIVRLCTKVCERNTFKFRHKGI